MLYSSDYLDKKERDKDIVYLRIPVDSILLAVLTVSPKRQYLGILTPTTPAQHGPLQNKRSKS